MNKQIKIIYATQTGTAKNVSNELSDLLDVNNFKSKVENIASYDYLSLPEEQPIIVFIISTTGYGEIPSNMKSFWNFILRKDLPENSLENLNYTIFGLGDSSYEQYNSSAKRLDKRLELLGGNKIFPMGLGDDQHDFGWEGEFDIWSEGFITRLNKMFGIKSNVNKETRSNYVSKISVLKETDYLKEKNSNNNTNSISQVSNSYNDFNFGEISSFDCFSCLLDDDNIDSEKADYTSKISSLKESDMLNKKTIFKLKIKENEISMNNNTTILPGDVISIFPENNDSQINQILDIIDLVKEEKVVVINQNEILNFSSLNNKVKKLDIINDTKDTKDICRYSITVYKLLKYFIDIQGIPNRNFCYQLAKFAPTEELKEKLLLFGTRSFEGMNEFYRYCYKAKKNYLDVLHDFKIKKNDKKIPLSELIDLIGFTRAREFSIADYIKNTTSNTDYNTKNEFEIFFNLNIFSNMFGMKKIGVCTRYLFELFQDFNKNISNESNNYKSLVRYSITKGTFPKLDLSKNYLLVCTGTGITPFLFFLKNREKAILEKPKGTVHLFYGCRYKEKDCIEKNYLDNLSETSKQNFFIHYALSREDNKSNFKSYVQTIMKERKEIVIELFKQDTQVVLVGNSKVLPKTIIKILNEIKTTSEKSISTNETNTTTTTKESNTTLNNKHEKIISDNFQKFIDEIYIESW